MNHIMMVGVFFINKYAIINRNKEIKKTQLMQQISFQIEDEIIKLCYIEVKYSPLFFFMENWKVKRVIVENKIEAEYFFQQSDIIDWVNLYKQYQLILFFLKFAKKNLGQILLGFVNEKINILLIELLSKDVQSMIVYDNGLVDKEYFAQLTQRTGISIIFMDCVDKVLENSDLIITDTLSEPFIENTFGKIVLSDEKSQCFFSPSQLIIMKDKLIDFNSNTNWMIKNNNEILGFLRMKMYHSKIEEMQEKMNYSYLFDKEGRLIPPKKILNLIKYLTSIYT